MLARRGRTHSVVLVDVLSCAKRRVRDHAMTLSCAGGSERAPSEIVVGRPVPHRSQQLIGEGVPVLVCGDSVGPSCIDGLCRGANKRPSKASLTKTKGRPT
ncbi:hypothetical protein CRG98_012760 [Punica granatum]|uniref:Uncharacterized protein n=1 Tax=Punica granatum TaxID=22663 RepID=A0A2I0KE06_PUNGR|nr:hypothetical protein CRG98_012760 [Punica granatum]